VDECGTTWNLEGRTPSPPLTYNELIYARDGIVSKAQHLRAFLLFAIDFL